MGKEEWGLWHCPHHHGQESPYWAPTATLLRSTHSPGMQECHPLSRHARVGDLQPNPPDLYKPLGHSGFLPLTLAEQLQAPPLLSHL